ncbi:MAG: glutathione S-transferase family protein [Candidatus Binatia bacterium]
MSELILHHYWESPYAEKIRRVMGMKGLSWRSVVIPMVMPKPDLTALTGGYRKTPVLQIGADIYCDSDLIARTIDRLHPNPTLFPDDSAAMTMMLGPWQQELFWLCVRTVGVSAPVFPPGFVEDRATMLDIPLTMEKVMADVEPQREQLRAKLDLLDSHLAQHLYVLGSQPSLADLSFFHPVYTLKLISQTASLLEPYSHLCAWVERIDAFGHGEFSDMSGGEAVAVARVATPASGQGVDPAEPNDLRLGDRIEIVHESFGNDPVVGELVASSVHEIAILREDDMAGQVCVHLPREHYKVRRV